MKVIGTVIVLLLSMPIIHVVLFGSRDVGIAVMYYWLFGLPTLLIAVPLLGYPLLALLRVTGLQGNKGRLAGTAFCACLGGLAISGAHGVILEVIAIAALFGGIYGFTWVSLAQKA